MANILPFGGVWPRIHPTAFVAPGATVIGNVTVGEQASIWFGAVLRGDNEPITIGARSNIQDLTLVHVMRDTHPTVIGDDVTVGHSAVVHGATIEDRCLIGMGAILLNGVRVGSESIVAAGSLLPEGFEVPPRSLVMGSPAKVRRGLTAEEVESIRGYASRYVTYRLDYT